MGKMLGFIVTGLFTLIVWNGPNEVPSALAAGKPVCQQDLLMAPLKTLTKAIAVAASPTGAISGTVTDKHGVFTGSVGGPIPNIQVTATQVLASNVCGGGVQQVATTDIHGNYTIPNLPGGSYTVKFENPMNQFLPPGMPKAVTQWYNNVANESLAAIVTVSAPDTTTGINAALYAGGAISGTVLGAGGLPLVGVSVTAASADGSQASATSGPAGTYELGGLASGTYSVSFSDSPGLHSPQYVTTTYPTQVSVTPPNSVTGINITMLQGGTISGTISPLSFAIVTIMPTGGQNVAGSTISFDGTFSVGGLAPGTYTVSINAQMSGFIPEIINGVSVSGTNTTDTGTTFLTPGGSITGTVRNSSLALLQNIVVMAFDAASGAYVGGDVSAEDGTYTVSGLATGSYKVQFLTCDNGYVSQWYNGQTTQGNATPVSVIAPDPTSGIDGTLAIAAPVTYPLTLTLAGTGGGSVNSDPPGINCVSGSACPAASYTGGAIVTLTAAPDSSSVFTGWSGGGCSGTGNCVVTMSSSVDVTATFTTQLPVKTDMTNAYNSSIVSAYTVAPSGAMLMLKAQNFIETFVFGLNKQVHIAGGYDAGFSSVVGRSSLKGPVSVRSGVVRVKYIVVQ